uniref:Innexin n=1 Tax=Globodera pallida TaxID=36090 RepID=A0A183C5V3_GLOPA
MVLTTVLSMMRYVSETDDRDFVDRMHSFFTTNLLIGLSVLVSFKQFGGKPIECLTPDIFSSSWEEYAENYCWAQDTYFVAPAAIVESMEKIERKQRRISYYQWVPFFLLLEAAFFRIPSILWCYMSGHSGIKISEIVKMSSDPNNIKPEIRKANLRSLTVHLQGALRFHKRLHRRQIRPHSILRMLNLPYSTSFVTSMYLMTKFAYLVNVLAQLVLMNSFLETDKYQLYGFGALVDLLNGTNWEQSGIFPRVRVMGNLQEYTIQCVYLCLLALTFGSFLYWLFVFILPWPNQRFITQHLEMCEIPFDPDESQKDVRRFISDYLRQDGLFVIRMLTLHTGVIFGTELVQSLWLSYFGGESSELKRSNSFPEGEFPTVGNNSHELENALNRMRTRRRISHLRPSSRHASNAGLPPPAITFGDQIANEKLIPPPAPSPSVKRLVNRLDRSRTNSASSSRESSPKKLNQPNWQHMPLEEKMKDAAAESATNYYATKQNNNKERTILP